MIFELLIFIFDSTMMSSIEEAANKIPLLTIHAGPKD